MSKVISIVDGYISGHDPKTSCGETKRRWLETRKSIIEKSPVPNSHGIVTDIKGERVCRPYRMEIDPFVQKGSAYGTFRYWCRIFSSRMISEMRELGVKPDMLVSLGKAEYIASQFHFILYDQSWPLDNGCLTLRKIVENGVLADFKPEKDYFPKGARVIIVEDFIFTGRSIVIAKEKIERLGGEVVGVISLANSLGDEWPFGTNLNITFVNMDFTKYPAGSCPICRGETMPPAV